MSYDVYRQPMQQKFSQEAKGTPLGRFAAWVAKKAAGTFLEWPISFILRDSLINRAAVGLTATLIVAGSIYLVSYIVGFSPGSDSCPHCGTKLASACAGIAVIFIKGVEGHLEINASISDTGYIFYFPAA